MSTVDSQEAREPSREAKERARSLRWRDCMAHTGGALDQAACETCLALALDDFAAKAVKDEREAVELAHQRNAAEMRRITVAINAAGDLPK